jgi:hypothetical protein
MLPASGAAMVLTPGMNLATTSFAALVKRFGRTQNAGLGIHREAAKKSEQSPAGVTPEPELDGISDQQGNDCGQQNTAARKRVRRDGSAGADQGDRSREGKSHRFRQKHSEGQGVSVARQSCENVVHKRLRVKSIDKRQRTKGSV